MIPAAALPPRLLERLGVRAVRVVDRADVAWPGFTESEATIRVRSQHIEWHWRGRVLRRNVRGRRK